MIKPLKNTWPWKISNVSINVMNCFIMFILFCVLSPLVVEKLLSRAPVYMITRCDNKSLFTLSPSFLFAPFPGRCWSFDPLRSTQLTFEWINSLSPLYVWGLSFVLMLNKTCPSSSFSFSLILLCLTIGYVTFTLCNALIQVSAKRQKEREEERDSILSF